MSAQGFAQEMRQRQTQQMVLAPQLRQSLKILQVAALDLRATIAEELQTNPSLEELPMDSVSLDSAMGNDSASPETDSSSGEGEELNFEENFEILNRLDDDWRDYMAQVGGQNAFTGEDAERRQHFFDSVVGEISLQEHLLGQAALLDLDEAGQRAMEQLVGNLDNGGFLTASLPEIALSSGVPLDAVQRAASLLKTLDPPGIGCGNLQECLLQQLLLKGRSKSIAARIIRDHFHHLARRRIPEIARKMGLDLEEVQTAIEEIGRLDPAPGRRFSEDTNRSVAPDVIVEKEDEEWIVRLNSEYIPRLRINPLYKEMLARGGLRREEKEYIREKMRGGKFLISSIEQRQQTIEKIAREIVKVQEEFLEEGIAKLRPLTMTQVADAVKVHETTVSRAIANKYMLTPHGLFEMKFFFTTGYQSSGGETISNTTVKEMIAHLVEAEDPAKPWSDQDIVAVLKEKGITIARRTVAKYREELGILPSNLRRQYS